MAQFKEMLLTPGVKGRPGKHISPKALVIHWTANLNRGANAIANRNYFNSGVAASAHYIVDDHQVVRCLPEDEMAYHVGAYHYTERALAELSSYPNNCTLGIEMCVNADGDFHKTYENTVNLAADILRRHGWGVDRLWRHYDVTGKDCPRYFVNDATAKHFGFPSAQAGWEQFKKDVGSLLISKEVSALFNDIQGHWASASIERLEKLGIVKGDDKGNFNPDKPITRAETVVLLDRLLKLLGR
ncbi:MAG: N-acetylmuramoyl-L-alanine amidase [Thermoanaerobacterium sp.]|nr:N-acetylmuramoyl-L-alanine amidase [Thermoanaerobacterium sp.]